MKRYLYLSLFILGLMTLDAVKPETTNALDVSQNSSGVNSNLQVSSGYVNSYQDQVGHPDQASTEAILQSDQIERSVLVQYKKDTDLIVGRYNYGSLTGLKLTKQQAEIIKNGFIPILGNRGDAPIANAAKDYVEYDCGGSCSGDRGVMRCGVSPMAYDGSKTEYEVMVKGSKYGVSTGGYVCAGPKSIKLQCSGIYDQNPCLNGTYQLDNQWLLSIGVDTTEIRRQIEANKRTYETPPQIQTPQIPIAEQTPVSPIAPSDIL